RGRAGDGWGGGWGPGPPPRAAVCRRIAGARVLVDEPLERWRPRPLELAHAGQQQLAVLARLADPGDHPAVGDHQRGHAPDAAPSGQPVLLADEPAGLRRAERPGEAGHLEARALRELEPDVGPGHVQALLQRCTAQAHLELEPRRFTL